MTELAVIVHEMDPFLVEFPESWPVDGIRWYGVAYLAGFVSCALLLAFYARRGLCRWSADQRADLLTAVILGALLGGRLGYVLLYGFGEFLEDPMSLLRIWEGGMASHGGFVGVACGFWWFARRHKQSIWLVADLAVTTAPPGLFFGRMANFINGELWGRVTDVSWAFQFPDAPINATTGVPDPRHPSQLYEAGLEGLLLFIWLQYRLWVSKVRPGCGQLAAEFLGVYAVVRVVGEQYREPDEGISLILGMSRGTFYSIFLIVAAVVIWRIGKRLNPEPSVDEKAG